MDIGHLRNLKRLIINYYIYGIESLINLEEIIVKCENNNATHYKNIASYHEYIKRHYKIGTAIKKLKRLNKNLSYHIISWVGKKIRKKIKIELFFYNNLRKSQLKYYYNYGSIGINSFTSFV